jgi:pimeloyl-ACP methyl ester carboxylesterase
VHPGYDGTACPSWVETVEDLAFLYDELLALEDAPVDLIGFSLGGWIALELALIASPAIRSLTLVGAPGIAVPDAPPGDLFAWPPAERVGRLVHDQDLARRLAAAPVDEAEAARRARSWEVTTRLARAAGWRSPRLDTWLRRVTPPCLVIWGAQDRLFPVAMAHAYGARLPDARVTVLEGCGHLVHLERHEELMKSVVEHLSALDDAEQVRDANREKAG